MIPFCSYCYEETCKPSVCGKCKHRKYCSRECQVSDWKNGHKHWCGKAGEIGADFSIREAECKGLGVFALRDFRRGEKIMAERGIPKDEEPTTSVRIAILKLVPHDSNNWDLKFRLNAIGTGSYLPDQPFVFITMSRTNHHCIGNTEHTFIEKHKICTLTAIRDIEAGEEITFSYVDFEADPDSYWSVPVIWRFRCKCSACQDPATLAKLMKLHHLDKKIVAMSQVRLR